MGVIATLFGLALTALVSGGLVTPPAPPCEYEDGSTQEVCYWDASEGGNGVGESFLSLMYGAATLYTDTGRLVIYGETPDAPVYDSHPHLTPVLAPECVNGQVPAGVDVCTMTKEGKHFVVTPDGAGEIFPETTIYFYPQP